MAAPRKYKLASKRTDSAARARLRRLIKRAGRSNDLGTWKRTRAVLEYVENKSVTDIAAELQADRSTVSRWIAAYAQRGIPALSPGKAPGAAPKLSEEQLAEVGRLVEAGPQAAGFASGVWTARMVGELIRRRFRVLYHWKYVPELLHKLGFSVQRPRKRLSRADHKAQEYWLRHTLPALKKRPSDKTRSSFSRTKPASSSTRPSIEPGLE